MTERVSDDPELQAAWERAVAAEATLGLGQLLVEEERFAEAEPLLRRAATAGEAEAWAPLGVALARLGHLTDARTAYERALEVTGDPDVFRLLGNLAHARGELATAEANFERAILAGQDLALLEYGDLLADWEGRENEAEAIYRRALACGLSEAHVDLGDLYRRLGRLKDAEAEYAAGVAVCDPRAEERTSALDEDEE